jgi:SPP1 family predicted phage head-tail adaptor
MPRKTLRRGHRKVTIGDMDSRICIQTRDLTEPVHGETNFTELFAGLDKTWAKIVTTTGKVVFDGVAEDVEVTHEVTIRYDSAVTTQSWILLEDARRLKIQKVEDFEERKEFLRLLCTDRGSSAKGAASA